MDITAEHRIQELYKQYLDVVCPFIIELETEDGEFPVEILNEIRAITTHLARFSIGTDAEISIKELSKAESHLKRAILDCFKYSCLSISMKHQKLRYDYRNADLHIIDNGTFLSNLNQLELAAKKSIKDAKRAEIDGNKTDDELYSLYEIAYQNTSDMYSCLENSLKKLEFAKSIADKNKKFSILSFIVGILGLIVGVAGIIIAFI